MVQVLNFRVRKVFLLILVLFIFAASSLLSAYADADGDLFRRRSGRRVLDLQHDDLPNPKKKSGDDSLTIKSQNKVVIKTNQNQSSKNQTKLVKNGLSLSMKNKTKLGKPVNSSTPNSGLLKIELKKQNSTSFKLSKLNSSFKQPPASNSTKTKKSSDLLKLSTPKNKTVTPTSTKQSQSQTHLDKTNKDQQKTVNQEKGKKQTQSQSQSQSQLSWFDEDLVSEFRDLPTKFQETLIPDLARISTTSKAYINQANKQMTKGFKPIVGNKYASTIASMISFAFIIIPLILVSLVFHRIKAYFSLQKLLIFIQIYLAIYFCILCLSSVVTGLEPLKFFYSTSQSTYVGLQVMQTLGYILYLLLLVMYLVLVFSTDCGLGSRMLGLGQTFIGYAVGLHYYVSVFHRMVLHQPPKTNWKIHGIYATCFLLICLLAGAERRKKAYLEEGGAEGKKS